MAIVFNFDTLNCFCTFCMWYINMLWEVLFFLEATAFGAASVRGRISCIPYCLQLSARIIYKQRTSYQRPCNFRGIGSLYERLLLWQYVTFSCFTSISSQRTWNNLVPSGRSKVDSIPVFLSSNFPFGLKKTPYSRNNEFCEEEENCW